jgi:hypothetical protein
VAHPVERRLLGNHAPTTCARAEAVGSESSRRQLCACQKSDSASLPHMLLVHAEHKLLNSF